MSMVNGYIRYPLVFDLIRLSDVVNDHYLIIIYNLYEVYKLYLSISHLYISICMVIPLDI